MKLLLTSAGISNQSIHKALVELLGKSVAEAKAVFVPNLDHEWFPENALSSLEKLAETISVPSYMIDDATAIKVVDGIIEVVSEGHWKLHKK